MSKKRKTSAKRLEAAKRCGDKIVKKECIECKKMFFQPRRRKLGACPACVIIRRKRFRPQTFKKCAHCGKEFRALHLRRIYCSQKCHYADPNKISGKLGKHYPHLQRAAKRNCKVCGKEFRAVTDHLHRKQLYCGKACWNRRNPPLEFVCRWCKKTFKARVGGKRKSAGAYCSIKCYFADPDAGMRVRHNPEITAEFMRSGYYKALHHWVGNKLGKPRECWGCGKTNGTPRSYQWANIDHTYQYRLQDWLRLCSSCHHLFDKGKKSEEWIREVAGKRKHK